RSIEAEQPRPPLHDAHGRKDRPRIAHLDARGERERPRVEPPGLEVAQPLGLLAVEPIQPPELLLNIVVRGGQPDVELTRDLPVAGACDTQIERLRGPLPARGIFADETIPRRGSTRFLDLHAFGCYVFGGLSRGYRPKNAKTGQFLRRVDPSTPTNATSIRVARRNQNNRRPMR